MKPDDIEQRVCERLRSLYGEAATPLIDDISQRQAFGLAKYGVRLKDNPAPLAARLRHILEELLDAAVYAEWIMDDIDGWTPPKGEVGEMQRKLMWMAYALKEMMPDEPVAADEEVWP